MPYEAPVGIEPLISNLVKAMATAYLVYNLTDVEATASVYSTTSILSSVPEDLSRALFSTRL